MKLKRPNLNADPHAARYLSVRKSRTACGISSAMVDAIGAEDGKHLHLAIDQDGRPWVGVLYEETSQTEPKICNKSWCHINSTLMATHLMNLLDGDHEGETVRFHMTPDTYYDEGIGATLYRLSLPS